MVQQRKNSLLRKTSQEDLKVTSLERKREAEQAVPDRLLLFPLVLCFALSVICIQHLIKEHARAHFANIQWHHSNNHGGLYGAWSRLWAKQRTVKVEILAIDNGPNMKVQDSNGTRMFLQVPDRRRFERRVDVSVPNPNTTLAEILLTAGVNYHPGVRIDVLAMARDKIVQSDQGSYSHDFGTKISELPGLTTLAVLQRDTNTKQQPTANAGQDELKTFNSGAPVVMLNGHGKLETDPDGTGEKLLVKDRRKNTIIDSDNRSPQGQKHFLQRVAPGNRKSSEDFDSIIR